MIKFRHYKEAEGKKTVPGEGNDCENWTLRVVLGTGSLFMARSAANPEIANRELILKSG